MPPPADRRRARRGARRRPPSHPVGTVAGTSGEGDTMMVRDTGDWAGQSWPRWTDLSWIRARLAAGADPDRGGRLWEPPLHDAAEFGSPDVVAELAARVSD